MLSNSKFLVISVVSVLSILSVTPVAAVNEKGEPEEGFKRPLTNLKKREKAGQPTQPPSSKKGKKSYTTTATTTTTTSEGTQEASDDLVSGLKTRFRGFASQLPPQGQNLPPQPIIFGTPLCQTAITTPHFDPNYFNQIWSYGYQARQYADHGMYTEALELLGNASSLLPHLQANPHNIREHLLWSWIEVYGQRYRALGNKQDRDAALAWCTYSLNHPYLNPDLYPRLLGTRGYLLSLSENYTLAIRDYEEVLKYFHPDYHCPYYRGLTLSLLAQTYDKMYNSEKGAQNAKEALEISDFRNSQHGKELIQYLSTTTRGKKLLNKLGIRSIATYTL